MQQGEFLNMESPKVTSFNSELPEYGTGRIHTSEKRHGFVSDQAILLIGGDARE